MTPGEHEGGRPSGIIPELAQRAALSFDLALVGHVRHAPFVWRALVLTLLSVVAALVLTLTAAARWSSTLPELEADGVGSVNFGVSKTQAVASLSRDLGKPTAEGISRACGPRFTEVAWHDLIAEFREGKFTGYRFVEGGWPLWSSQSFHQVAATRPPSPPLKTVRGITLGSTLSQLRAGYGKLKLSGAVQWTAPNGLSFIESSTVVNPRSPADKIAEIHIGTCGTDQ